MSQPTTGCRCACHVHPAATCTVDTGSTGVPGKPSCSPCFNPGAVTAPTPCSRCEAAPDEPHTWVEGDCVLPHSRHSTKLIPGGHVCVRCHDRHPRWISEIVELYATLAHVVIAGSVSEMTEYQRHQKAPASPSPLRLDAWAMLNGQLNSYVKDADGTMQHTGTTGLPDVPSILSNWAQAAFDALGYTHTAPDTVTGAAAVLAANNDLLSRLPDVDTYDAELRWVWASLRVAHGKGTKGTKPVGRCPSLDGWGATCGGPLWADQFGRMAVQCGKCHRRFDELFLSHLGGMLSA